MFSYVNDLVNQQVFQNLCGLLYFTDGKGVYPKKCPAYKTAFIYLEDYDQSKVPSWAIQYRLEEKYEYITGKNEIKIQYRHIYRRIALVNMKLNLRIKGLYC